jgi:N-acetylneuraminic acid mutarotase
MKMVFLWMKTDKRHYRMSNWATLLSWMLVASLTIPGYVQTVMGLPVEHNGSSSVVLKRRAAGLGTSIDPPWRAFHASTLVDDYLIVFGGISEMRQPFDATGTNDLYVYNLQDGHWYKPETNNGPQLSYKMHSGVTTPDGHSLFYAANVSQTDPRGPLMYLSTDDWTWSYSNDNIGTPPARVGQSFTRAGTQIYMYGGISLGPGGIVKFGAVQNDMNLLDTINGRWRALANSASVYGHSSCYIESLNALLIFGGIDLVNKAINQLIVYNISQNIWDQSPPLIVKESMPLARSWHSANCIDNMMVVFGGGSIDQESGRVTPADNDVWVLEATSNGYSWSRKTVKNPKDAPSPRMGHSALVDGDRILIWGGIGKEKDTHVYALDTKNWVWTSAAPNKTLPSPDDVIEEDDDRDSLILVIVILCVVLLLLLITALIWFIIRRRRRRRAKAAETGANVDSGTTAMSTPVIMHAAAETDDKVDAPPTPATTSTAKPTAEIAPSVDTTEKTDATSKQELVEQTAETGHADTSDHQKKPDITASRSPEYISCMGAVLIDVAEHQDIITNL